MLYFEDVELGDEIGPLETEATDDGVLEFCQVWDNRTPNRFTDQAIAEKATLPGPAGRPFPLVDFGADPIKELF